MIDSRAECMACDVADEPRLRVVGDLGEEISATRKFGSAVIRLGILLDGFVLLKCPFFMLNQYIPYGALDASVGYCKRILDFRAAGHRSGLCWCVTLR
jgi:hypothetical protein